MTVAGIPEAQLTRRRQLSRMQKVELLGRVATLEALIGPHPTAMDAYARYEAEVSG